ncbi:PREDICTED: putative F-box/LRR-repeat protein At3g44080 [Fragaria vesca subsp. vesca]|uniref:putative F-box/LRR-repeat protein At3g44080 n=1 Tax=Fragaria vesca subsp. vesca TaxID=101020 RepID=UPI0002C3431C|nr:PREDICTED: putative F-box/LRR-repeat protein At3g44080 [Fragaria vesca subsp. vesca]
MDALPDLVIHEILKSLSTKQAVRAIILSKQWERVWFSVPALDFDVDEIEQLGEDDDLHANRLRRHIKFAEFVTMCLKRREKDKSLHRLRLRIRMRYLSLDETCSSHIVRKCLRFAMNRHVKELYLAVIDGSESLFVLGNIEVSSSSLKSLEFISFPERHARLQVEAMNLESLGVGSEKGKSWSSYTIDFASCGQLRN